MPEHATIEAALAYIRQTEGWNWDWVASETKDEEGWSSIEIYAEDEDENRTPLFGMDTPGEEWSLPLAESVVHLHNNISVIQQLVDLCRQREAALEQAIKAGGIKCSVVGGIWTGYKHFEPETYPELEKALAERKGGENGS